MGGDVNTECDDSKLMYHPHKGMTALLVILMVNCVDWKKIHDLKIENYVLFSGLTEDLSLGYSLSDSSEKPGYIGVFAKKKQNPR